MVLGSHFDLLQQQERSLKKTFLHNTCQSKWLMIDCRMPASSSMTKLHHILKEHCNEVNSSLHIHCHAHAFAAFLKHTIKIACQQYYIEQSIDAYGFPVTDFKDEVEELLKNLSNCGYILYLPDKNMPSESWIILDQEIILQGIHGYQERARALNSKLAVAITGVITLQELRELFTISGCSPRLIIRYLVLMEFCHEIDNEEILKALTKTTCKMDGRYFFFPDLVKAEAPLDMWLEDERMTCYSGFVFRCHSSEEFISPRFVQVLLLHIALDLCATVDNEEIFLKNCSTWKNGIYWANLVVETIVELTEGRRSLLVVCRSEERNKMELVKHRTAVLEMVNEVVKRYPRLSLDKLVLHPKNCLPHPVNFSDQVKMYSFKNVLQALKTANKPNVQYVHRTVQETQVAASQCHIDELLCFEPYSLVRSNQLAVISQWSGQMSEEWLYENIATYNMSKWKEAATMLNIDQATIEEISTKQQSASSLFRNAIGEWLNSFDRPEFSDLLSKLNKYSIFREEDLVENN